MKNINLIFLVFFLGLPFFGHAQQDAQYTQYVYNTISVNPAYAGSRDALSGAVLYRNQWVGVGGAPVTQTFNIHSPLGRKNKIGLGLSVVNDKIGPASETFFDVDFSYTIHTRYGGQLAFGLKAGGNLLDVNFNELNQYTNTDILLSTNVEQNFSPNIGLGFYFHKEKYYIGFSVPKLIETEHFDINNNNTANSFLARDRVNYYLVGGYVFDLNYYIQFKPATLIKLVSGAPIQVDLSANFLINEKFEAGIAYRWSAAFSALVGFQVSKKLYLGLAYDRETTELGNTEFSGGSYEFLLRYEILKNKKVVHPRFF